jgi:hypothetical protein
MTPDPRLSLPAALGEVVADEAELEAPLAMLPDRVELPLPEVDMLWPDDRVAGAVLEAAATVAGSTEVVAGIYQSV